MRIKPRTRSQWAVLVCDVLKIIERDATHTDLKELAHSSLVILGYPGAYRNNKAFFERLDRLMDRCDGIEHETIDAKHIQEHMESRSLEQ